MAVVMVWKSASEWHCMQAFVAHPHMWPLSRHSHGLHVGCVPPHASGTVRPFDVFMSGLSIPAEVVTNSDEDC
eukprot:7425925-Karenia_brevis.AAC.1